VAFEAKLAGRNASDYADFLLPYLTPTFRVLDVGCGDGTISVGLAEVAGHVVGVDPDEDAFGEARRYATRQGIDNVDFRAGDVYSLEVDDNEFDACLCHSVLEAIDRPLEALHEIKRTLKPGGVIGAASVEYGGLILAGPNEPLLRRFYAIRERIWQLDGVADPHRGRALRAARGRRIRARRGDNQVLLLWNRRSCASVRDGPCRGLPRRALRQLGASAWPRHCRRPQRDGSCVARMVAISRRVCRVRLVSSDRVQAHGWEREVA
jgi:SAM-dependent methyltransferase